MNNKIFSLIFGLSSWLMMTLAFRFWGHDFFLIDNDLLLVSFFLGTIPLFYSMIRWVHKRHRLSGMKRLESAVYIAIPGMIGDVFCIGFHEWVFPAMTTRQSIVLSAWILWAFVLVLLIGVVESKKGKTYRQSTSSQS